MTDLSFLTFDQLLEQYFAHHGVEAELARRFGTAATVLVVDVRPPHGRGHGVGHALALAAAAWRLLGPVLDVHGRAPATGQSAARRYVFDDAGHALVAALDAQRALATGGLGGAPDHPVRARVGLGAGEVLLAPDGEAAGPEMDRATTLGGTLARPGEVLATEAFLRALGPLPAGVGGFRAPADREQAAGFAFHVLADYR